MAGQVEFHAVTPGRWDDLARLFGPRGACAGCWCMWPRLRGWCAVAPRTEYMRLASSPVMAPVDEQPVWSVPCLFVTRPWRGRGLSARLLTEAARFAAARGARAPRG